MQNTINFYILPEPTYLFINHLDYLELRDVGGELGGKGKNTKYVDIIIL